MQHAYECNLPWGKLQRQIMHPVIQSCMPIFLKKKKNLKQDRISGNVSLQLSSPGGNNIIQLALPICRFYICRFNQPGIESL